MPTSFSRRSLLKTAGFGLAALAVPGFRSATVRAAPRADGRLLIFFTPNGFYRESFGADGEGTNFVLRESLAPLERHRDQLVVLNGLCVKSATDKSSHEDITRVLTCKRGTDMYRGYGPSIDHTIARALGTRPLTLAGAPFREEPNWQTTLSWVDAGAHDPHIADPDTAFAAAFSNYMPGASGPDLAAQRAQGRSVLDVVSGDLAALRSRVGRVDRERLDRHLESVRRLETRLADTPTNVRSCDNSALEDRLQTPVPADDIAAVRDRGELMVDLATSAFACTNRKVATVQLQEGCGGVNTSGLGTAGHHRVSHYETDNAAAQWRAIDRFYAERFAYTLDRLTDLGLIDNTIVVWVSEISEDHHLNNFTTLVAGGRNLGVRTGQHIRYPFHGSERDKVGAGRDPRNASMADLWVSVQRAFGLDATTFGDAGDCRGGLEGLLG